MELYQASLMKGRKTIKPRDASRDFPWHHKKLFVHLLRQKKSGMTFLVDTGATVSVFPVSHRGFIRRENSSLLIAANGTPISSFGHRDIILMVGNTVLRWPFLLARVTRPILGVDFLCHSGLLVDIRNRQLVKADSWDVAPLQPTTGESRTVLEVSQQAPEYEAWIRARYPEPLIPTFSASTVKHGVKLHIPTHGRPVFAQARRLSPDKLAVAKEAFNQMEDSGIVRRSESAWSSPLHLVPKDDGSWGPCGDFRRLNDITEPDKCPVPHIQDFSAKLAGRRIFSKIDLIRGYHQIPVAKQDVHKTAVITSLGLYEFLGTPFRLKNPAQAFQQLMASVCRGLVFVFVYLDDILVASRDWDEHRVHLAKLFSRLKNQ